MEYEPRESDDQEIDAASHFTPIADGDGSVRAAGLSFQHGGSAPCDGEKLSWRAPPIDFLGELRLEPSALQRLPMVNKIQAPDRFSWSGSRQSAH